MAQDRDFDLERIWRTPAPEELNCRARIIERLSVLPPAELLERLRRLPPTPALDRFPERPSPRAARQGPAMPMAGSGRKPAPFYVLLAAEVEARLVEERAFRLSDRAHWFKAMCERAGQAAAVYRRCRIRRVAQDGVPAWEWEDELVEG